MSSFLQQPLHDSDSEDEDYAPTAEVDSDDDIKPQHDRPAEPAGVVEDKEATKKARDALWADFQASVSTPPPAKPEEPSKTFLKIEKRYRFAGKEVTEVVEVAADSADAKIWPLWRPAEILDSSLTSQLSPPTSLAGLPIPTADASLPPPETRPSAGRRPGPRKSKTTLSAPPPKAKKLSTLDKSAMDWNAHINTHSESEARDELEANRRGGGYLEKVDFLKRVDARKEDVIEANKPTKRRKL